MSIAVLDETELRSVTMVDHPGSWTEEQYLALGETSSRIELVDGGLWVSPAPNKPHQMIGARLLHALDAPAEEAGLLAFLAINVRLGVDRLVIPDLVLTDTSPFGLVTDAHEIVLACEIVSPSNATVDRVLKMRLYADAGIPWYLLVEPDLTSYETITLHLLRLVGGQYEEHATATGDETLETMEPFPISLPVAGLIRFRRVTP